MNLGLNKMEPFIFFVLLGIFHRTQTVEEFQNEYFQEDPLSGDGNEIDYFQNDAFASYWRDERSTVAKTATHYSKACQELSKFVPNLSTYAKAKERCSMYCDAGKIQPGRNFFN